MGVLEASNSPRKLIENLRDVLDAAAIEALEADFDSHVIALFELGHTHFAFANSLESRHWRQIVSRLYYGAYNAARAVRLKCHGQYSTDSSDHKKFEQIPDEISEKARFASKLESLRVDRNVCDYDHTAKEADLLDSVSDTKVLVAEFFVATRQFLVGRGVRI